MINPLTICFKKFKSFVGVKGTNSKGYSFKVIRTILLKLRKERRKGRKKLFSSFVENYNRDER